MATIDGTSGNDTLTGGADNDEITGFAGDDSLSGLGGDDTLVGNTGNDTLIGGSGNDSLDGSEDTDLAQGGVGDDIYVVQGNADVVVENAGEGTDLVQSTAGYLLSDNVENLTLLGAANSKGTGNALANEIIGSSGNNQLLGNGGDDTLIGGSGNDSLDGGEDTDLAQGGVGDDVYVVQGNVDVVVENAGEGTDRTQSRGSVVLAENVEHLTLTGDGNWSGVGNTLDNEVVGNNGANELKGRGGNDTLDGGAGVDTLLGGLGDDIYVVEGNADVVVENADEGTDLVQSTAGYLLSDNVENLTLLGAANSKGTGNALANEIIGSSGHNRLLGNGDDDTLGGGGGDDTLDGGSGADVLKANSGNDVLVWDPNDAKLAGGSGNDIVSLDGGGGSLDLTTISDSHIVDMEIIDATGSGDNTVTLALDDVLAISSTTDTLRIDGNAGDSLRATDAQNWTQQANQTIGANTYLVFTQAAATLLIDADMDAAIGPGGGGDTIEGTPGDDSLSGGTGNDSIDGAGGNDTLDGDGGDDTLVGGPGNDSMLGGSGHDSLDGGIGIDTMAGGTGNDIYIVNPNTVAVVENPNEGIDRVHSASSAVLSANVEHLTLTGNADITGTGNALDNEITGNDGDSQLFGLDGNDLLNGGAGSSENTLDGGAGADTLAGGLGADTLSGGSGNDSLDGGGTQQAVRDSMMGGLGDDIYVVDNELDVVVENAGEGIDLVIYAGEGDPALATNVENLTLTDDAIVGRGNDLANVITGSGNSESLIGVNGNDTLIGGAGDDRLLGGSGADSMSGGVGNDSYNVDSSADVVVENAGEGIDFVLSYVDFVLPDAVENLMGRRSGTGNALDNSIVGEGGHHNNFFIGNGGNDTLEGRFGLDTLDGGAGADVLSGGDANDILLWDPDDASVNGGLHEDTLRLVGGGVSLDLTQISNSHIVDIEIIDAAGSGDNSVTLALADVLAISSEGDTLRIDGNAGDSLTATDAAGWTQQADQGIGSNTYSVYTQSTATLFVDTDIATNL